MSSIAAGTAWRSGLRCSSIGVPITTTTCSASPMTSATWSPGGDPKRAPPAAPRGPGLVEGHRAAVDHRHRLLVDVVERDVEAAAGEREPERQADVAAAADDRDPFGADALRYHARTRSRRVEDCMLPGA